jgi:hypothetical protein
MGLENEMKSKDNTKIKIGGHCYHIRYEKGLARNHEAAGMSCANELSIILDPDGKKSHINEIFWHEVVEQINYLHELSLSHSTITTLGTCLQQILSDNPETVEEFT